MATGVVSVSAHLLGIVWLADPLLWLNVAAYSVLVVLTALRLAFYFRRVVEDLTDHARGPAFFTIVAGTCMLGSQIVTLTGGRIYKLTINQASNSLASEIPEPGSMVLVALGLFALGAASRRKAGK